MASRPRGFSLFDCSALVTVVERLLGERERDGNGMADRLCQEVAALTRHRAQLWLHPAERARGIRSEAPSGACLYPVEFAARTYGTLAIMPDSHDPMAPALPNSLARQLARVCGPLLCMLEQVAVLDALTRHLALEAPDPLTPRQREVLALIARGLSDDEVANALHIAPCTLRRHRCDLYARLNVHDAHDLPLVAYQYGLVSFITPGATPPPRTIAGWR